jgi:hypothetical protein
VSRLAAAAFAAALGASLLLLFLPVYDSDPGGGATLVQENGAWVIAVLAVPVAIAGAALVLPRRARAIVAGLAGAFVVATGFTVGVFYAPTAILLIIAAGRR